MGRPGGV